MDNDILNPWATDTDDVPWPTPAVVADSDEPTDTPDQWESARHDKEGLNRAVPPQVLESLLRHCQHVAQELWPPPDTAVDDSWRSAFDGLPDLAALLAQLLPADSTPPPAVPFSATATAKAVNDALKSTRHFPASASSPLSRLLASKGSLDWENSVKARQDVVVSDSSHAGWRVLEKDDRLGTTEDSKPRRATGGLLSFWNRRVSTTPVETQRERSTSPARSSLETAKSSPHQPASRAASPSKAPSVPPPPLTPSQTTPAATTAAPSAVSRFLNRFARTKSSQHTALALSSDDLEFLSDIVPSATDPPEEDSDRALNSLTNNHPSPLPPILPPPPNKLSSPSSVLGSGNLDAVSVDPSTPTPFQVQGTNHAPNVPVLAPPPTTSFSLTRNPKDVPTTAFGSSKSRSIGQESQPSYSPNSLARSSTLPPPSLSIPPLLPPPPASPRTPRPSTFSSAATPAYSPAMRSTDDDSHDSDDEFSAFTSFPPVTPAPFPRVGSYQGSQSPPSPPPRRTYERTHYPSSSSASSIFSPASVDQLCSTKSSISTSFESFDDFVSPPLVVRGEKHTPSPPPLPAKVESRPRQPPRIDAFPSRDYHTHTPSQSITSPTVHTSLISSGSSAPSFTNKEHQRTQSLVDQAAARAGMLWPDSPESNAARARAILPPPSSFTSPKMPIREVDFDLLGGGDTFSSGLEIPVGVAGGVGIAGGSGEGLVGSRSQLVPLPPQSPSTPTPGQAFSSLVPSTAMQPGPLQSVKPRQTGGLSAQDLSFFEGL